MLTRLSFSLFALDEGAYPGGELHPVRGLGDKVVGSRLDCPDLGVGVVQGGDHDHGDHARRRVGLHPAARFEAVHTGHHRIEEDQVDVAGRERLQGLFAIASADRVAVERLKHGLEDLRVDRFVVDDEHSEAAVGNRLAPGVFKTDAASPTGLRVDEGSFSLADEFVLVEGLLRRGASDADRKLPLKALLNCGPKSADDRLRVVNGRIEKENGEHVAEVSRGEVRFAHALPDDRGDLLECPVPFD